MKVQDLEQLAVHRLASYPPRSQDLRRVSEAAGLPQRFLRQIARGERPIPRQHLNALLEAVGLTYDVVVADARTGERLTPPPVTGTSLEQPPGD